MVVTTVMTMTMTAWTDSAVTLNKLQGRDVSQQQDVSMTPCTTQSVRDFSGMHQQKGPKTWSYSPVASSWELHDKTHGSLTLVCSRSRHTWQGWDRILTEVYRADGDSSQEQKPSVSEMHSPESCLAPYAVDNIQPQHHFNKCKQTWLYCSTTERYFDSSLHVFHDTLIITILL